MINYVITLDKPNNYNNKKTKMKIQIYPCDNDLKFCNSKVKFVILLYIKM